MSHPGSSERAAAVAAYADHLVAGGTETWAQWWASGSRTSGSELSSGPVPTDLQLEVVRRLALLRTPELAGLAELVLRTPAAGRGRMEAPPPWPPDGAGPMPEQLPAHELLRVCAPVLVTLLERLLAGNTAGGAPESRRPSLLARWRRRSTPRVVPAGPFEAMMARAWQHRVAAGATVGWVRWWRRAMLRDTIPRGADPGRVAATLAARRGPRVQVVLAEEPDAEGMPDPVATDLWRRLNLVLRHRNLDRERVSAVLPGLLVPDGGRRTVLAAPAEARIWADHAARRVATTLIEDAEAAGYAVRGDVAVVLRRLPAPDRPRTQETLELALRACGRAWQEVRR